MTLSGQQKAGGMFSAMTQGMDPTPSTEDIEKEREAALYNKHVKLVNVQVKTFDLSITDHADKYAKLMQRTFAGLQTHECMILYHDRKFVETPEPRWIVHFEWAEFELVIKPNLPIGSADG